MESWKQYILEDTLWTLLSRLYLLILVEHYSLRPGSFFQLIILAHVCISSMLCLYNLISQDVLL